jgi:hypothetical protein
VAVDIGAAESSRTQHIVLAMFLLGDQFDGEQKRANYDSYDPLTSGDSSLSDCVQSIVTAVVRNEEHALAYFRFALLMDLADAAGKASDRRPHRLGGGRLAGAGVRPRRACATPTARSPSRRGCHRRGVRWRSHSGSEVVASCGSSSRTTRSATSSRPLAGTIPIAQSPSVAGRIECRSR